MLTLNAHPLSAAAFAPYGEVVSTGMKKGTDANQGTAVRFDWCATLQNHRHTAQPNLSVFRSSAQAVPFSARILERHPYSSQTFLPLVCSRFLILVAPSTGTGEPDLLQLKAFVSGAGQGINYHANVWHHPIVALDRSAEFAMLAWEDGSSGDCEEQRLIEPVLVVV